MSRSSSSAAQPVRVAAAVEALVVVAHEPAHRLREAAELVEQAACPTRGGAGSTRVLRRRRAGRASSGSRRARRACRCRGRGRRSRARAAGRGERPSTLADLHGAQRDAARVLLGVVVLLGRGASVSARTCEPRKRSSAARARRRRGRRRAAATARVRARSSATGMPTTRIPSSSSPWPSHQPSCA